MNTTPAPHDLAAPHDAASPSGAATHATTQPVLGAYGLSLRIRDQLILDSVDLTFDAGQFSVIVGPNGAGKSSLIALLTGEQRPTFGHAALRGTEVRSIPVRQAARQRAVMDQHTAVTFPFRAGEVIAMGRTPWRGTPEALHDDAATASAADATEVTHLLDRPITMLSGGERQRVALARVVAQRPFAAEGHGRAEGALILDEPISALDIRHQERTLRLLRGLAHEGTCVIAVLHDLDAAAAYADRLVVMSHGRVVADGEVDEVCRGGLLSRVYRTEIDVLRTPDGRLLRVGPRR